MNILITGGTGLVGKHLANALQAKKYAIGILSRTKNTNINTFVWDIPSQTMDKNALEWADVVVHLAGTSVADKPWTNARKKDILESRTLSTRLLAQSIAELPAEKRPHTFVGASAVGYYGLDTEDDLMREEHGAGKDFLADVTEKWEAESQAIANMGLRVSLWRIGVVLAKEGGALPAMTNPVKWGVGSPLGSGKQWVSWIHIHDLVKMLVFAIENEHIRGVYNAVAPNPVTNTTLTKCIGKTLKMPMFLPAVPAFVLRLILGEMAQIVLGGNRVSAEKIQKEGFVYEFTEIQPALEDLFHVKKG